MNSKNLLSLLIISIFLGINSHAQESFKSKFKTRSRYKSGMKNTKATSISVPSTGTTTNLNTENQKDNFGRTQDVPTLSNDKKRVLINLNPETAFGPEVMESFEFENIALTDLTKHMQKLTGLNLILDKDLKGKITIMAPNPITVGDVWKAYLTALNINGYTLVKSGAFYKIVNSRDIRYTPTKIYTGNYTPNTENYAMRIIPLKNINSSEVTRSFRPFMSRYGRIIEIKQTNTIIVQDTGENINRLVRLIKFIDIPGHEETLQIIKIKNSSAQEIAKLLGQILKGEGSSKFKSRARSTEKSGGQISNIIAEPRTNSIIAMANASGAKRLRKLLKQLDVKSVSASTGQIHVHYLEYAESEKLAKTLSGLVSAAGTKKKASSRFSSRISSSSDTGLFNNQVKITADKDNNALVITAAPTDYLTLQQVIKKLDIPRDQVYVEGLMMETNVNNGSNVGISILGAYGSGGAQKAGFQGGTADLLGLLAGNYTTLGGLFAGAGIGGKKTVTGADGKTLNVNAVNALITAIATDASTNVLATPQILVLDNEEGTFEVGESIPTIEKATTNGTIQTSTKAQKVGLTLTITPQINKVTRFIKLKINQKIQDFSDRSLPDGLKNEGVATNDRNIVTTVVVRDKDTLAMGGLMRDKESETVSKVPLLGDIPVLGWLFRNKKKTNEKVNLLFFLTPKIISPYEKAQASNLKDMINRRNAHLKEEIAEKDPFATTIKGLYKKAEKQLKGPLYDKNEALKYKEESPIHKQKEELESTKNDLKVPNYKKIMDMVSRKKAAIMKNEGK